MTQILKMVGFISRQLKIITCFVFVVTACTGEPVSAPVFHEDKNPAQLSDWGIITAKNNTLHLSDDVLPYDLATPLFSDYAQKLRTIWIPEGQQAHYSPGDAFAFPVGTIVSKTFYYAQSDDGAVTQSPLRTVSSGVMALNDIKLVETRLLVRREHGWDALPYIWNEDQTDAVLARTGDIKPMTFRHMSGEEESFAYVVPNANQCAACHASDATKQIKPIGLKARHLNKPSTFATAFNQLDHWIASGMLDAASVTGNTPMNADWTDKSAPFDTRARSYLDINCSHCHNPAGPADTSGLNLEPDATGPALGTCKVPIAAGGGTGGHRFDITPGAPEDSIMLYRMEITDPGAMMPELGRALVHAEGTALIAEWIEQMEGDCGQ